VLLSDSSGLLIWGALSDERTGLSITTAAGPNQQSRGTRDHILLSDIRDSPPPPGGPGSQICIVQEQGSPAVPQGTALSFRRLLRWRYQNQPPRGAPHTNTLPIIISRCGPQRKHQSSVAVSNCYRTNMLLYEAVTLYLIIPWPMLSNGSICHNYS
jgi:hypothetical protein